MPSISNGFQVLAFTGGPAVGQPDRRLRGDPVAGAARPRHGQPAAATGPRHHGPGQDRGPARPAHARRQRAGLPRPGHLHPARPDLQRGDRQLQRLRAGRRCEAKTNANGVATFTISSSFPARSRSTSRPTWSTRARPTRTATRPSSRSGSAREPGARAVTTRRGRMMSAAITAPAHARPASARPRTSRSRRSAASATSSSGCSSGLHRVEHGLLSRFALTAGLRAVPPGVVPDRARQPRPA